MTEPPIDIIVPAELAGLRLDQALAQLFPQYSRSRLKTWVLQGAVTVDGRTRRPRDEILGGEHVILIPDVQRESVSRPEAIDLDIAYEDESYNLVSNPEHVKREETTLVNARVAWDSPNQQWQVTAWAKNLTDEIYYPASGSVPWLDTVYAADPKTYGIDVRYQL